MSRRVVAGPELRAGVVARGARAEADTASQLTHRVVWRGLARSAPSPAGRTRPLPHSLPSSPLPSGTESRSRLVHARGRRRRAYPLLDTPFAVARAIAQSNPPRTRSTQPLGHPLSRHAVAVGRGIPHFARQRLRDTPRNAHSLLNSSFLIRGGISDSTRLPAGRTRPLPHSLPGSPLPSEVESHSRLARARGRWRRVPMPYSTRRCPLREESRLVGWPTESETPPHTCPLLDPSLPSEVESHSADPVPRRRLTPTYPYSLVVCRWGRNRALDSLTCGGHATGPLSLTRHAVAVGRGISTSAASAREHTTAAHPSIT